MKNLFFLLSFLLTPYCYAQTDRYTVDALVTPKVPARIITVGSARADIPGFTNEAIQRAVDALPPNGGTVKMDAGEYKMKAPVRLPSN
ncbi:MAG TPA: hypothetical protein VF490_20570, partial [Chryseosolibacter sp.]